ncbi:MAG: hypothetical protein CMK59_08095 [Proteobacteria bacterium]|nr:hypothetical protein [Pseudomonadota bacterium]
MLIAHLFSCTIEAPHISVWANLLDADATLVWEGISLHPAQAPWESNWPEIQDYERNTFHKKQSGAVFLGSGTVPEMRYHHTFIDLEEGNSQTTNLIDIIEPIATPFSAFGGHSYKISIDLMIIDEQIFAVDSEVTEE